MSSLMRKTTTVTTTIEIDRRPLVINFAKSDAGARRCGSIAQGASDMSPPLQDVRQPGNFGDVLRADPEAWAIRIRARWQMGVEAIISTGRLLLEAKEILPHGSFQRMVEEELPFKIRMAQMLMTIAANPLFSNAQYIALLPPTVTTMYDCARLTPPEFERGVVEGIIRPDMERADVERIRPTPRREAVVDDRRDLIENSSSDGGGESRPAHGLDGEARDLTPPDTAPVREELGAGVAPGPSEATQMPGGGLSIAHNRVEPSDSLDFFPTPPWATRSFFEHVLAHLNRLQHCKLQRAREPACGEGHMSEVMREYFREVLPSDKGDAYDYDYEVADFLDPDFAKDRDDADWIVTNPPFGPKGEEFVLQALKIAGTGVAMFVRLQWLETPGRYERIFKNNPPSLVAIFSERVPLHKGRWVFNGKTMTAYAWVLWIKGMPPQPLFWIPPGCRVALTKADDAARFGAVYEYDNNEAPASEAAE